MNPYPFELGKRADAAWDYNDDLYGEVMMANYLNNRPAPYIESQNSLEAPGDVDMEAIKAGKLIV